MDIFRVIVETPMEEIYNVTEEELLTSEVTDKVMEQVREHHAVLRAYKTTPADHQIAHLALAFELVYPKSRELVRDQGYLSRMFEFPTRNEKTKRALDETRKEIESFLAD